MAQDQTPSDYLAYAKPGPYSTTLAPGDEAKFQSWVQQNKIPWADSPTADYDMRGYWQAQQAGDPNAKRAANLHFPDTWKTPYHRTFSNESKYALPTAGHWTGNTFVPPQQVTSQAASQTTGTQFPGSDALLDTLRRANMTDSDRQRAWDAYQKSPDESSFIQSIRSLNLTDDMRQKMYDLRFKGPLNYQAPWQRSTQTEAPHDPLSLIAGPGSMKPPASTNPGYGMQDRTKVPINLFTGNYTSQKALDESGNRDENGESPTQPSHGDMFKALTAPGMLFDPSNPVAGKSRSQQANENIAPSLAAARLLHERGLFDVNTATGATDPVARGAGNFATQMIRPESLAFVGGGEVFEGLPSLARATMNGIFTAQMGESLYKQSPEFRQAVQQGDWAKAVEVGTEMVPTAAMTFLSGLHTLKEGYQVTRGLKETTTAQVALEQPPIPAKEKSFSAPVAAPAQKDSPYAAFEQAQAKKVANAYANPNIDSTPLGPISETGGQQLQMSFVTKAPIEAIAPMEQSGDSKVASAPPVDRTAVIAPKPLDIADSKESAPDTKISNPSSSTEEPAPGNTNSISQPSKVPDSESRKKVQKPTPGLELPQNQTAQEVEAASPVNGPESFALPKEILDTFHKIAKRSRDADLAETDDRLKTLLDQKEALINATNSKVQDHLRTLTGDQIKQLRDSSTQAANKLDAQSKFAEQLTDSHVKNEGLRKEITDLRFVGGTVPHRGVVAEDGTLGLVRPEDSQVGMEARRTLDELQGRVPNPGERVLNLANKPEGMSDEDLAKHVQTLQGALKKVQRTLTDNINIVKMRREAGDTAASIYDVDTDKHIQNMNELESEIARYTDPVAPNVTGRRPNVQHQFDENGVPKKVAPLQGWTVDLANRFFQKKLRALPTPEEFYQEAGMLGEKAQMHRDVADAAQKYLDRRTNQRGSIGEVPLRGGINPVKLQAPPTAEDFLDRIRKLGTITRNHLGDPVVSRRGENSVQIQKITPETDTTGSAGFLVVDKKGGSFFVHSQSTTMNDRLSHSEIAEAAYPHLRDPIKDTALRHVLSNPDIGRKSTYGAYEFSNSPSKKLLNSIDMDILRDRMTNQPIHVDVTGRFGKTHPVTVPPGWENFGDALKKAVGRELEQGKSLTGNLTGATAGAVTGAVIGTHLGGPIGGTVGGVAGFVAGFTVPAIVESEPFKGAMSHMAPFLDKAKIDWHTWMNGPPQQEVSEWYKPMHQEQVMHMNKAAQTWYSRVKQLPEDLAKGFDPYVQVADKNNYSYIARLMTKWAKDGKGFHDLTLPDTHSFYLSLLDAKKRAFGGRWGVADLYMATVDDAQKAGINHLLDEHMFYKQAVRGFQNLEEHSQEVQQKIQEAQSQLRDPNNTARMNVAFQDKLRELEGYAKDIEKTVSTGKVVGGGLTPDLLQQRMEEFHQRIGLGTLMKLNSYSDRIFNARAHILDMLESEGLITPEAHEMFTNRGKEYVPLRRIMDDLAEKKFASGTRPLDLKHQTVIRDFEGSARTPENWRQAFVKADAESFNQIERNRTMSSLVDLAQTFPDTIGKELKPVALDYKAKAGESTLGHYVGGKPHMYAVPQYLGDVMEFAPAAAKTAIGAGMSFFGRQWRRSVTVGTLGFQTTAFFAHALTGLALSESNRADVMRYAKSWGKAIHGVLNKTEEFKEMVRSGASFGTMAAIVNPEELVNPKDLGAWNQLKAGHIFDAMETAAQNLENVNKLATFRNARLAGHSIEAAMKETVRFGGMPDFSGVGDLGHIVRGSLMFVTAANKYAKQFGDAYRRNPQAIGGIVIATAAMSIAVNYWNNQLTDSNGNSLWRKVSQYEKDRNWIFLLPFTHMVKGVERAYQINFKKPYYGRIMNPVDDLVNRAISGDARSGVQEALDGINSVSPMQLHLQQGQLIRSGVSSVFSSLHPIPKTAIEQAFNVNDFGRPIVPPKQQQIDSRLQVRPGTSSIAKTMSQGGWKGAAAGGAMGGIVGHLFGGPPGLVAGTAVGAAYGAFPSSPERTDAFMRSMFSTGASQTESYMNAFVGDGKTKQQSTFDKARNLPVVGPLVKSVTGGTGDQSLVELQNQFEAKAQGLRQIMNTVRYLKSTNPTAIRPYLDENHIDLPKAMLADGLTGQIHKLDTAIQHLPDNTSYTPEQKDQMLQHLLQLKKSALENGLKRLNQ